MQNLQIPEVHSLKTTPGAGRKTIVTRDISTQKDRKLRKPVFNTTDPGYPASTLFLLEFTATTSKVWLFLVYDLKNFSQMNSCSEKRWNETSSSMNKNHAKVQGQWRTHGKKKKKKNPEKPTSCYFNQLPHWTQEGIYKTFQGSNQDADHVPTNPVGLGATFPTRRWSAYALKQQRQTLKLPKFKK